MRISVFPYEQCKHSAKLAIFSFFGPLSLFTREWNRRTVCRSTFCRTFFESIAFYSREGYALKCSHLTNTSEPSFLERYVIVPCERGLIFHVTSCALLPEKQTERMRYTPSSMKNFGNGFEKSKRLVN